MPTVIEVDPPTPGVGVACVTDCHATPESDAMRVGVTDERRRVPACRASPAAATRAGALICAAFAASARACASCDCSGASLSSLRLRLGLDLVTLARVGFSSIVYHNATRSTPTRMPTARFFVFMTPPCRSPRPGRSTASGRYHCDRGEREAAASSSVGRGSPLRAGDVDVARSAAPLPSRRSTPRASGSPSPFPANEIVPVSTGATGAGTVVGVVVVADDSTELDPDVAGGGR